MILVDNLTKTYKDGNGDVVALKDINLYIDEGEFVSVAGPSGSGKSTFLLSLGGLITPTLGKVVVNGISIYDMSVAGKAELRLNIVGFMFQTFNLIPYLTALENVQVPLCLANSSGEEQESLATELLERVGLGHRLKHKPAALSVGERQRVALARCLANKPSVILADEPTGNLDPAMSEDILNYFEELHGQGMTIVMVTHDRSAAEHAKIQLRIVEGKLSEN